MSPSRPFTRKTTPTPSIPPCAAGRGSPAQAAGSSPPPSPSSPSSVIDRQLDRVRQGVKLLLDRQLPHGGWNFGNTLVYGTELLPSEEYIGVALTGLAGHCEEAQVAQSIAFIEGPSRQDSHTSRARLGHPRPRRVGPSPGLCRSGHFRMPRSAGTQLGPFDTSHLALLLLASHCSGGLITLFPAAKS